MVDTSLRIVTILPVWVLLICCALLAEDGRGARPAAGEEAKAQVENQQFWSFRPLKHAPPPAIEGDSWSRTPIDTFILARLKSKHLGPNVVVDRRKLIRRLYWTLIGMPPEPDQVQEFLQNTRLDAFERLVDRVLAFPHFGERWARHWLDIARFAESNGYEFDKDRPHAHHYRDFVIESFNRDLPFDAFARWQIAGDEIAPENTLAKAATGFLAAGVYPSPVTVNELEVNRYDELDDMISTIGTAMLGLTINCARCHDHKYDPISTRDYYNLASAFTTTVRGEVVPEQSAEYHAKKKKFDIEHAPVLAKLTQYEQGPLTARFTKWIHEPPKERKLPADPDSTVSEILDYLNEHGPERLSKEHRDSLFAWYSTFDPQWKALNQEVQEHRSKREPPQVKFFVASEGIEPFSRFIQGKNFFEKTYILGRGDPSQKLEEALLGFLGVLMADPEHSGRWIQSPPEGSTALYKRTAVARWITDTEHGAGNLLARVIVNRLWYHHLGRGIVNTPSDFGFQGDRPTHPELLDWLAGELIASGWSLKHIHRLIVTSTVFMQDSSHDQARAKIDPDNRYYWRYAPRRLEAESIRDAMLVVAGNLDRTIYGPGTLDEDHHRRSLYFTVKRSLLIPTMQLFDWPDTLTGLGRRLTTTSAPQALFFMNSPLAVKYSRDFARRLKQSGESSTLEAVEQAYWIALGRQPTSSERARSVRYIESQAESFRLEGESDPGHLALASFCQVLMSLNEFVYVQ